MVSGILGRRPQEKQKAKRCRQVKLSHRNRGIPLLLHIAITRANYRIELIISTASCPINTMIGRPGSNELRQLRSLRRRQKLNASWKVTQKNSEQKTKDGNKKSEGELFDHNFSNEMRARFAFPTEHPFF